MSILKEMSVVAIILAAGESSRLGEPKQLLRFHGETLLARSIRLAADAGAYPILAVVGAHWARIREAVALTPAVPVFNPNWAEGIASSLRAGLEALETQSPRSDGALLMTCDQPYLTSAHLITLLDQFRAHHAERIVASSYSDAVGTPAVFSRDLYVRLCSLRGDKGARVVLDEESDKLMLVPFPLGEIDIDRPEDKQRLL